MSYTRPIMNKRKINKCVNNHIDFKIIDNNPEKKVKNGYDDDDEYIPDKNDDSSNSDDPGNSDNWDDEDDLVDEDKFDYNDGWLVKDSDSDELEGFDQYNVVDDELEKLLGSNLNKNNKGKKTNNDEKNAQYNGSISKEKLKVLNKCINPSCDHNPRSTNVTFSTLTKIRNIDDLIELASTYHCKKNINWKNINLKVLHNLVYDLVELKHMIGMKDLKTKIVNQILFFLKGLHVKEDCGKCQGCNNNLLCTGSERDMMHTVMTGPPGVGKTCVARIIGKLYANMGMLSNGEFNEIDRTDLIAKYLGQTAHATQDTINKCKGGVMFIDEAYSLGSSGGGNEDSFSKECLDILNRNLSECRDLLCIIVGYEEQLNDCFFRVNPGLKRRFSFKYNIDGYNYKELYKIFRLKLKKGGWKIKEGDEKKIITMFRDHHNAFKYFGGDIETLFLHSRIYNSKTIYDDLEPRTLTHKDVRCGIIGLAKSRKVYKKVVGSNY